jgi:hypothetical protein
MTHEDAINWLKYAQDITPDDGVSAYFEHYNRVWQMSYPETTGYIIPTLIAAGEEERALRASRWLRRMQMADGSMSAGFWNSHAPCAFDTAQVLLGWLNAEHVEHDPRTLESIDKAMAFLEDEWRIEQWGEDTKTYNVRSVWPMKLYGSTLTEEILDYFEEKVRDNGWVENCEEERDYPLTHFIAYVARGFLECGRVEVARKIATALADCFHRDGVLCARFDENWQPQLRQICVPGIAQAAIIWHRLGMHEDYNAVMGYLAKLNKPWASDPSNGMYLPLAEISWSAKFIADAYKCKSS